MELEAVLGSIDWALGADASGLEITREKMPEAFGSSSTGDGSAAGWACVEGEPDIRLFPPLTDHDIADPDIEGDAR